MKNLRFINATLDRYRKVNGMTNDLISRSALIAELMNNCLTVCNGLNIAMWLAKCINEAPAVDAFPITGDTSDGYHTFNELYHHRAVLFSVICNSMPEMCWKSKKHHDGTMFDGMFIVGINTPEGQATYHYDLDPYWNMFHVKEVDSAPEWDGHTPDEAIRRIGTLAMVKDAEPVRHGEWSDYQINGYDGLHPVYETRCSLCDKYAKFTYRYCPHCGARMDGV